MPRGKPSRRSQPRSKLSTARQTALGRRLLASAQEMLAHARGELQLTEIEYPVLSDIDVKRLRESLGLSQADFARLYGINMRALQDWEQGRRRPESAVRAYLTVIRKDPDFVARALKLTA